MIFVFGSNEAGIHGAGAAKYAMEREGAIWQHGVGMAGNSYALPTKDKRIRTLPINDVKRYVTDFVRFAVSNPHLQFKVTRVGCGLAGFKDSDIAPLLKGAPSNCQFDNVWAPILGDGYNYWGTV